MAAVLTRMNAKPTSRNKIRDLEPDFSVLKTYLPPSEFLQP